MYRTKRILVRLQTGAKQTWGDKEDEISSKALTATQEMPDLNEESSAQGLETSS